MDSGPVAALHPERVNARFCAAVRSIEMDRFGSEVKQAVETVTRTASIIADAANGRVDVQLAIPGLSALINGAQGPPRWADQVEKLSIGSVDDTGITVVAQYNPAAIQINKQIPWQQNNRLAGAKKKHSEDSDDMEINTSPTRTMSVELLFDGYEDHRSIQPELDKLEVLSSIRNPGSKDSAQRRPHYCVVAWGAGTQPRFSCVITSLSTRLLMFAPNGAPLRATSTVELTEVDVVSKLVTEADTVKAAAQAVLAVIRGLP